MADGAIDKLSIEIGASSTKAVNGINRIAKALGELKTVLAGENGETARKLNDLAGALGKISSLGNISIGNKLPDQLKNLSAAISCVTDDTIRKLDEMTAAIERLKGIDLRGFSNAVKAAKNASGQSTALATIGSQGMAKTGALVPAGNAFTDHDLFMQIQRDFFTKPQTGSGGGGTEEAAKKTSLLTAALERLKRAAAEASDRMKNMDKAAKKSSMTLGSLASAFKRIAMYRFLRSVIKAITTAFSEGLQAAYQFSAGMSSEGHRFAAAMDSMKAATNQMKGQIGSAFIALLTAIQPIITAIINLVTRLADAISQVFSAFTGTTYLKANKTASQFADTMASGAASAKEWKNQLLSFDVINRLEAPSDGGGGGGSSPLAGYSMEDTPINEKILEMVRKLKEDLASIDLQPLINAWEHLKTAVKGFADVVGDYLAAVWREVLLPLAKWTIQEVAPRLVELLATAFEFLTAVLERLKPVFQWIWENVLKPIADFVGDAFLSFLDSVIDLLGKLTDLISGKTTFKEFLESLTPGQGILLALATAFIAVNGVITIFTTIVGIATTVAGLLSAAIAAIASPVGLVILAITALIAIFIAIRQHWDDIVARFKQGGEELRGDWERTKEFFSSSAESIKQAFSNLGKSIAEPFKQGAAEIRADMERIKATVQSAINAIKQAFESVKTAIANVFNSILNIVSNIVNSIIGLVQRMVSAISNAFRAVGSFGGSIGASIRGYASGGFPEDGLFFANHGEMVGKFSNGKTAVANNQEITAGIASAVYDAFTAALEDASGNGGGQKTEFVLNLNGREFARAIYNDQNAVQKEYGVSYLASA